jgi:cytidylate kinase
MAVITISRQYGSGGDEIAARVGQMLGYFYFDKRLMARVASEAGIAEGEVVDFSEDDYKGRNFLERLFGRRQSSRTADEIGTWKSDLTFPLTREVEKLDEDYSIGLVQSTIRAAYKHGNIVIVGRGGQAILKEMPDVLHVRIQAPYSARIERLCDRENYSLGGAKDIAIKRDRAAADYLKRFYDIDWADPMLYDLVINTGKLGIEAAAHLIVNAMSYMSPAESGD